MEFWHWHLRHSCVPGLFSHASTRTSRLRKGLCSQCVCFSFFSSAAFYARLGIANLLQFELLRHGGWGSFNGTTDCQHCWRLPDRQVLAMLVLNASLGYVAQLSPTYSLHFRCELGKSLKSVKVPSASLHKVLLILFSDKMNYLSYLYLLLTMASWSGAFLQTTSTPALSWGGPCGSYSIDAIQLRSGLCLGYSVDILLDIL